MSQDQKEKSSYKSKPKIYMENIQVSGNQTPHIK